MSSGLLHLPVRDADENEPITTVNLFPISCGNPAPSDPTPEQIRRIVQTSGALDFWDDPAEDLYTAEDGDPL